MNKKIGEDSSLRRQNLGKSDQHCVVTILHFVYDVDLCVAIDAHNLIILIYNLSGQFMAADHMNASAILLTK